MDIVLEMYGLTIFLFSFAVNSTIYKFRTCRFIMRININNNITSSYNFILFCVILQNHIDGQWSLALIKIKAF